MSENNLVFKEYTESIYDDSKQFMVFLMMKEKCPMPNKDTMDRVMAKHFGEVENTAYDEVGAGYALKKYNIGSKDEPLYVMITILNCSETENEYIDPFERSQMRHCQNPDQILEECKYQVVAGDIFGAGLGTHERAEMITDYVEALLELYPTCEAVYFEKSGKLFAAETLRTCEVPKEDRFLYYVVNVRIMSVEETGDMIMDSLGMSLVHMPDLQYHFHDFDLNSVWHHAFTMLSGIFHNKLSSLEFYAEKEDDEFIKLSYYFNNDCTVEGIVDGDFSMDVQWTCHYERSLMQPPRDVIDVSMGEYAAGQRENNQHTLGIIDNTN